MVPFLVDLKGKTAVVTGGGGVLCSAFAKALAECGASVAVLDLNKEAADKVANEIKENGGNAIGISANVLEKASLLAAREEVEKTRLLISKKGRASYLGEKSIGYQDPGATSALIIFEAIYDSYKELRIYKRYLESLPDENYSFEEHKNIKKKK